MITAPYNAFRNGKIHVCARMCSTCIFRPHPEDLRTRVTNEAIRQDTAVICHHTLGTGANAVCYGFYKRHATMPLRLAEAMGAVEFDEALVS
jgi:hypothetical protein